MSLAGRQIINLGSMPRKQISPLQARRDNATNLLVSSLRTSLVIASHHQTLYVTLVLHLIVVLISENIFPCFYHIRYLHRIRRYISRLVAKTIATALITSRLNYCNSLLYNIASKEILRLQCVQNCLAWVVTF